mmetsp:Transcript_21095/g.54012  ORF Transcript_21095/g.54012 Transcript_21095/m.54012 type:complete len:620 (-) Transcript_21095:130-1989(-)
MEIAWPTLATLAWTVPVPPHTFQPASMPQSMAAQHLRMVAAEPAVGMNRWEGDDARRPLGEMERLLNARRSWSGAMTTAHVSAAIINGPALTEAELLVGLEWVLRRHPLLAARVRGKSKFHVPDAKPYPMHSDYLGRAVAYTKELLRTYPDDDIQFFEPSPLSLSELARRALDVVAVSGSDGDEALGAAWRAGFSEAMDALVLDEEGDGPLWKVTLYAEPGGTSSAIVYAANHAISDQLSFNLILSEVLQTCAERRAGREVTAPSPLPLPPSVEGALLGREQRQAEEIKERLELIIGQFGEAWGPQIGGRKWLPSWKPGRARLSTIKYAAWQMAASGMKVLPRWIPPVEQIEAEEAKWQHQARSTRSVFRELEPSTTSALVEACRARSVTASGALCAAAVLGASDVMGTADNPEDPAASQRYKLLQALDMRTLNFAEGDADAPGARDDWSKGTVLAGTGSLDILVDLPPEAGASVRAGGLESFWDCASTCNRQTREWIASGWGRESLLLFSSGWEFMNMNRVVELGSQDRATLGRAYSAGVSNVGRYAHSTSHGDLGLSRIFFGISQTVSAPAISVSAVTVDGRLCLSVQYAAPIWPDDRAEAYADDVVRTLEMAAGTV